MTNPNDPAYPVTFEDGMAEKFTTGLTKREEFAKAAMQGLLVNKSDSRNKSSDDIFRSVAILSVRYADALIAEL